MRAYPTLRCCFVGLSTIIVLAGCKSTPKDSLNPDSSALPDLPVAAQDTKVAAPDLPGAVDTMAPPSLDAADAAIADANVTDIAAVGPDTRLPSLDGGADINSVRVDATTDAANSADTADTAFAPDTADTVSAPDTADAAFVPGPATAIVVNSGPTGDYSLPDGTWKVFYFDAVADQVYAVSQLSGIVRGYVSANASVSPASYQWATNADGNLSFIAPATQRYYVAVAVVGGGASGSFQVADGGKPIALGSTVLTFTTSDGGDAYYFFHFPISAGHSYTIDATGPYQPNVGIAVCPFASRSLYGQFSGSLWGVAGSLPFNNEVIPADSVANSYSGFYYFYIRVLGDITLTLTITQSP